VDGGLSGVAQHIAWPTSWALNCMIPELDLPRKHQDQNATFGIKHSVKCCKKATKNPEKLRVFVDKVVKPRYNYA
jgi:hypothetical protein